MTRPDETSDRLQPLLTAMFEERLSDQQVDDLRLLLRNNPAAQREYVRHAVTHAMLQWINAPSEVDAGNGRPEQDTRGIDGRETNDDRPASVPLSSPVLTFLSPTRHGVVGYFSSGWPVAYLAATVILGIGLLIGSLMPASFLPQIAKQSSPSIGPVVEPKAELVGRITGMVDCQWARHGSGGSGQGPGIGDRQSSIPNPQSGVSLGDTFALASGLMEITYDTGAQVILQGPVTYEVESKAGGYLSVGKLTAKVEKKVASGQWPVASESEIRNLKSQVSNSQSPVPNPSLSTIHSPLFTIKTPTATVTDLGTEFAVEVGREGNTTSHVFRGSVKVRLAGAGAANRNNTVVLHENESVQARRTTGATEPSVRLYRVSPDPHAFVRRIAAPVSALDLRDVVAGGDGRVERRPRDRSPFNSVEETVLVPQPGAGQKLHRFGTADRLIDRIFLPDGNQGAVQLDSAGHGFDGFPRSNGKLYGSIDATAADVRSNPKTTPGNRGLLGLRSSAGITFDLNAVREKYAGMRPARFRATAFSGSSVGVVTLFQDDFQSAKAGTMPRDASVALLPSTAARDGGGRWAAFPDADTTVQVWNNVNPGKPTNDAGPNNYARVLGDNDVTATDWPAAATTNNPVEVSFSLWEDSTKPVRTAVAGFVGQLDNERSFTVYFHPNGTVSYYDGDTILATGITYHTDTWQDVKIKADLATQTFSLSVGGATAERLHWKSGTNSVNCIYFGCNGPRPGQFFIDNVKITSLADLAESRRRGFGRDGQGDLWVFVDGRLKLQRLKFRPQDGPLPVDVELGPDDRFLTLVGTGDGTPQLWNWIVFGDPVLEMTSSERPKP